jgi:hypothetical protein
MSCTADRTQTRQAVSHENALGARSRPLRWRKPPGMATFIPGNKSRRAECGTYAVTEILIVAVRTHSVPRTRPNAALAAAAKTRSKPAAVLADCVILALPKPGAALIVCKISCGGIGRADRKATRRGLRTAERVIGGPNMEAARSQRLRLASACAGPNSGRIQHSRGRAGGANCRFRD